MYITRKYKIYKMSRVTGKSSKALRRLLLVHGIHVLGFHCKTTTADNVLKTRLYYGNIYSITTLVISTMTIKTQYNIL